MYIIYYTNKIREHPLDEEDTFSDEYIIVETEEKAKKHYESLLHLDFIYTAGYAKILKSTDYHED